LANPRDEGAGALSGMSWPKAVVWRPFRNLRALLTEYLQTSAWYGTDTGLYHVAVALGLPATVFFGPTQPWRVVAREQPNVKVVRLVGLGQAHCDVISCRNAACLHHAVAIWAGNSAPIDSSGTPANCPLRNLESESLERIT